MTFDVFQSTLSVRRATGYGLGEQAQLGISIHALRKESDTTNILVDSPTVGISIHALRKESDGLRAVRCGRGGYFNPRSP